MTDPTPSAWKGALAGWAGGLAASLVMNGFQATLVKAGMVEKPRGDPSTIKAANLVADAVDGAPVPKGHRRLASDAVHYGLGAALGVAYGVAAEERPALTAGLGTGFGLATSLVIDETVVPLAGLGPSPRAASAGSHVYGLDSHLVFGATAEVTRKSA